MTFGIFVAIIGSMKISAPFCEALEKSPRPLFLLSIETGWHPSQISRIKNGMEIKRPHDIRFRLLAEKLGYKGELFDETKPEVKPA